MSERIATTAEGCTFCAIVVGEVPASIVHEDDLVLAFLTIEPVNPGHAMVIPKRHAADLAEADEATWAHVCVVARRVAQAIGESGVRCEGVNLFLADGEAAFQEIPHLHLHVFPRYRGDGFDLVADWSVSPPRGELDAVAARIRTAYDRVFGPGERSGRPGQTRAAASGPPYPAPP